MKGIDISEYQTNVDYNKLKSQGIEFAIIRSGYGKNSNQKDSMFETHYNGLKKAGLKVGCYHFSYASTIEGAELEAENCLKFINGKQFDLPVFYDVEDEKTTGKADKYTITKMCETFCNKIKNAGYNSGVYASLYWFNSKMYVEELENKYYIWLAQWHDVITAKFKVNLWQYGKGEISGIKGEVDMNEIINMESEKEKTGIYQNGSTVENVFADTDLKTKIGCLNRFETCECLGIFQNRAIVRYKIDGTNIYKIGFVEWLGRCKMMDFFIRFNYRKFSR